MKPYRARFILGAVASISALTSACSPPMTPADLRSQTDGGRRFQFAQASSTVKACLVPALDQIKPFTLEPSTRPPMVRDLGGKTEIFAQDETITVYLVDLEVTSARSSQAAVYAKTSALLEHLAGAVRSCGGAPAS